MKILSLATRAVTAPSKIPFALKIELKSLGVILRYGLPDIMLQFLGGIGDELLLTAVAHEIKKRNRGLKIWQVSHSIELFKYNPDYYNVFDWNHWYLRYSHLLDPQRRILQYAEQIIPGELEKPAGRHVIAELCSKAGVVGEIEIRPYFYLTAEEKALGRIADCQIVIQCVGENSYENVQRNKIWPKEKFQSVISFLKKKIRTKSMKIIQLGSAKDPPLEDVLDFRGKTTLRESAAILSQSEVFVGTAGFLSHLARAAECRSIIIYGGKEHSYQTGYCCNENLNSFVDCAPCWRWNGCANDRKCMEMIEVDHVIRAYERVQRRKGLPLEAEVIRL